MASNCLKNISLRRLLVCGLSAKTEKRYAQNTEFECKDLRHKVLVWKEQGYQSVEMMTKENQDASQESAWEQREQRQEMSPHF